jgi:hypothetical protein
VDEEKYLIVNPAIAEELKTGKRQRRQPQYAQIFWDDWKKALEKQMVDAVRKKAKEKNT